MLLEELGDNVVPWETLDECLMAVAEHQSVYRCAFPPKGLLAGRQKGEGGVEEGKEVGLIALAVCMYKHTFVLFHLGGVEHM